MRETKMASLGNALSPDVLHALGWALIHSLWQGAGLAALAAILMALPRRPSVRYLIATLALAAMLAAPLAGFLVSIRSDAPRQALLPMTALQIADTSAVMPLPGDMATRVERVVL